MDVFYHPSNITLNEFVESFAIIWERKKQRI